MCWGSAHSIAGWRKNLVRPSSWRSPTPVSYTHPPHVELGESDGLHVGDFVVALGHSKGFDTERRAPLRMGRLCTDGKQRFLISECTLIGGDSGGPLFDLSGKLVGLSLIHI